MPLGLGAPPPMGGANPQNLQALAAAGDPRAIALLQQMQGGGQPGMPPQGGPPQGMPPQGGPPGGGMPPMGPAPSMSQADFSGYGNGPNPDAQARQAAMLIQALRNRR